MVPVTSPPAAQEQATSRADAAGRVRLVSLRSTALSVDEVLAAVADPVAGGHALFVGTVRDHDAGLDVADLSYSAHPSASRALWHVALDVAADDGVVAVAAVHRLGDLAIGDVAVVVAVSAVHRAEAFAASPPTHRPAQGRRPDLEAPALRRRHRGVGRGRGVRRRVSLPPTLAS